MFDIEIRRHLTRQSCTFFSLFCSYGFTFTSRPIPFSSVEGTWWVRLCLIVREQSWRRQSGRMTQVRKERDNVAKSVSAVCFHFAPG